MCFISDFSSLTLRFLELLNQKLIGILGLGHNELLEKVFHKFKDLFLLEVEFDVLLVFKFLDLIHFLYLLIKLSYFISHHEGFWGFGEIGRAHV